MVDTNNIDIVLDELLVRIAKRDRDALAEFYTLTEKFVFASILSIIRDYSMASDIKHDVYIKIMNNADKYYGGKPRAWCLRIAKNLSLNYIKKTKREVSLEVTPDIASNFTVEGKSDVLKSALKVLNETEKKVLLYHLVLGYKHEETAKLLKLPLSTIKYKYLRALEKTKKEVINYESI